MKTSSFFMAILSFLFMSCNSSTKYASYDDYPVYDGQDMELTYSPELSKFRIWAPSADKVKLLLYEDGLSGSAYLVLDMKKSEQGTWVKEVDKDLLGKFYTFQVNINDAWLDETPGIWAKATGVNGKRAAIIDFAKTNPEGWMDYKRAKVENFTDMIVYEVHIRDFSVSPTSGIKNKGKYLGFTERGTTNADGLSTGLDHLIEMGVTHVQLLPPFDYASIDETKLQDNNYNWGYDPLNYNVPEGGYSTDPYDPYSRIREFKTMIHALHNAGISVIMDVVYNHTYTGDKSHLNLQVPGYFYRMKADSTWSNASGCGNETASERAMMRNFIVESVAYWVNEYHIDGFRFDLMGIHDIETMNEVRAVLNEIDPSISLYGEGWTADSSPLGEEKRAVKKNIRKLDNIAVFSDDIRDAMRGGWMNAEVPGFVSGVADLEESVKFGVAGASLHPQVDYTKPIYSKEPYAAHPSQIVNYVSCHDDMCLVDKLNYSKPAGTTAEELLRFNKLAQTVVFTSMGIPFVYAGEELYRSKLGVHNTYQSPDSVNQINWDNKTICNDLYNYYKGLIALRNAHPAFRIATQEMMVEKLHFIDFEEPNVVAYTLSDHANGDSWEDILVIYNGNREPVRLDMPEANWTVVCYDGQINLDGIAKQTKSSFVVPASSAAILYQ